MSAICSGKFFMPPAMSADQKRYRRWRISARSTPKYACFHWRESWKGLSFNGRWSAPTPCSIAAITSPPDSPSMRPAPPRSGRSFPALPFVPAAKWRCSASINTATLATAACLPKRGKTAIAAPKAASLRRSPELSAAYKRPKPSRHCWIGTRHCRDGCCGWMPLPWNFAPLASGPICNVRYVPTPPFRGRHLKCGRGPAKLPRFGFFAISTIFSLSARGEYSMPSVKLRENEPFEVALRRFKRTCEKAGVLTETRRREFYEKPTTVRKRKAAAAVKRHLKKMQRDRVARVRLYRSIANNPTVKSTPQGLRQRIEEDMKSAMRAKEKERLATLRLIWAAIKQREVDERITLNDSHILAVLDKMIKQRRDSITQYQAAQRQELADQEAAEIVVIQQYLPAALSEAELDTQNHKNQNTTDTQTPQDDGKVMALLKPKLQGRADMGLASRKIKDALSR